MHYRRIVVASCACFALIAFARHPTADIRILTHDSTDRMPHQVRAALDLGLIGVSVLYTWTARPIG